MLSITPRGAGVWTAAISPMRYQMQAKLGVAIGALLLLVVVAVRPSAQAAPPAPGAPAGQAGPPRGRGGPAAQSFPAQQRPPGDRALIARGGGLYGVHCRACHGVDLRGGDQGGPNLLRSQVVLNDQSGELLAPIIQNGRQGATGAMPPIAVTPDDVRALAEYIHSVAATMRGQGSPPAGPAAVLNVLVGNAAAGQAYFAAKCGSCHSATGDLQGLGRRVSDPTALQNYWLSAGGALARPAALAPASQRVTVTVTPASGARVEGTLVRVDDFYVVVRLADETQRSFRRTGELPAVEIRDPLEPHRRLLPTYTDNDIHDVTAYLVTLK